ncbi:hypothetical protein BH23BAC4_BH23BAC4_02270 [soil metagenome]
MAPSRSKLPAFIVEYRNAVANARTSDEILSVLVENGYSVATLQAMEDELQALIDAAHRQDQQLAVKKTAVEESRQARKDFQRDLYGPHLTIAGRIFRNDGSAATRLGLRGRRAAGFAEWQRQACQFYDNAIAEADLNAPLGERGIALATLEGARAELDVLADAISTRENQKGAAKASTAAKDVIRKELSDELADFREIARVAFRDQPELLAILGIPRGPWKRRPRSGE